MNDARKNRVVIAAILAAMAVCISGCSSNPDDNGGADTTTTTTVATTDSSEEEESSEEESEPEESSEEESSEEESEPEESEPEESEPEEDPEPASGEVMTQLELITYINQQFGMILSENTPEANIEAAKSWNFIDDSFEADAPITPEMALTAIIKAAVSDAEDASLEDIIIIALENGIIDDANIAKLDLTKAEEMVDRTVDLWAHGGFIDAGGDFEFKTTDDVLDLTSTLTSSDLIYNDDSTITLPVDVVEVLDLGDNIKLPKDSKGNGGGTYIVTATMIVGSSASIQVEAVE